MLWDLLEKVGLLGRERFCLPPTFCRTTKRIALGSYGCLKVPLWILDEPLLRLIKRRGDSAALFDEHAQHGGIVLLTSHRSAKFSSAKLNLAAYKAE